MRLPRVGEVLGPGDAVQSRHLADPGPAEARDESAVGVPQPDTRRFATGAVQHEVELEQALRTVPGTVEEFALRQQ